MPVEFHIFSSVFAENITVARQFGEIVSSLAVATRIVELEKAPLWLERKETVTHMRREDRSKTRNYIAN